MSVQIIAIQSTDTSAWDEFVYSHNRSNLYHLAGWGNIISKTYGHKTYYLMAINSSKLPGEIGSAFHRAGKAQSSKGDCLTAHQLSTENYELDANHVVGILPLVHLKHFFFSNSLISVPFFDFGGILSNDEETEKALLLEAIKLGQQLKVDNIELRNTEPLSWITVSSQLTAHSSKDNDECLLRNGIINSTKPMNPINSVICETKPYKVRMLLELPESSDVLMKSFKSKLRSQIKKPIKAGLSSKIGGSELLNDFYEVFSINMRYLGSPVHSKEMMENILEEFSDLAKIVIVYFEKQPVACSMIVGLKDTVENPWASSLRRYQKFSPNMLLYWTMLKYTCDHGFKFFDFGRCTPGSGTFKFKEQWGARPEPLHWHYISLDGRPIDDSISEKSSFEFAAKIWQKLPVPVTKIVGPRIRKYIGL